MDGPDLFVASLDGDSLTEIDASAGTLSRSRVLSGPAYGFESPAALTLAGNDLFVANSAGGSVTELLA
jgi:hypothetical protein